MKAWKIVLILAMAMMLGCGGKGNDSAGPTKLSKEDVDTLSTEHSKFENSLDPPISAETRYAAGQLAQSRGDAPTAILQYKAALDINPKYHQALFALGIVYTQAKMYPEAIETWQQYVKATDGDGEAWADLGFCYQLAGQLDKAEETYRKGIAAKRGADSSRVNYGLMLARMGREQEAIAQLGAALRPAEVHYNLGSVYEQMGRKEQAKVEYTKALQLDPSLRDAKARLTNLR